MSYHDPLKIVMGVGEAANLNTFGECKAYSPDTVPIPYHLKLNFAVVPPMPPPPTPTGTLVPISRGNLDNLNSIRECDPYNDKGNIYYHLTLDLPKEKP